MSRRPTPGSRGRRWSWIALLLGIVTLLLPSGAQAAWSAQTSTLPGAIVTGTSCPTTTSCVQIQVGGKSQSTTNGGTTWTLSGSSLSGSNYGLACPTTTLCVATAVTGDIYRSTNLGASWTMVVNGSTAMYGVDCPSASICYAVGASARIQKSTDGGLTWTLGTSQGSPTLYSVSCPSTTVCYSTAAAGATYKKQSGSDTWDLVSPSTDRADLISPYTSGLTCPSVTVCFEGGTDGTISKTSDGGATWVEQTSGTTPDIYAISCVTVTRCMAVGVAQKSVFTDDGGTTWNTANATGSAAAMYSVGWAGPATAMAGDAIGDTYVFGAPAPPDAQLSVSETLTPGTLAFIDSTPGNVVFPTRALTNADQVVTAGQPLVVADATGSGNGWSVAVTSTTFTTGSRTLANDATRVLGAPTVACKASTTCTPATNTVGYPLTLPAGTTAPTAEKLFGAQAGTGLGAQTITPTWSLRVPATTYTGTYTSTWTYTLTSGP